MQGGAQQRRASLAVAQPEAAGEVPCCPPYGPQPPAPFPAKYETRWFTQPRDHFNYFNPNDPVTNDTTTFQQRFLYYDAHWRGPPNPIIMVPCVEAGPAPYYWGEYGWVIDTLAAELGALVVFAEHRGFGLTYPQPMTEGGDASGWIPDAAHVGVLTEAQVLEDDTALATSLRFNLSAWDSPLIAIGGSLSGEMSTWWRVRYPHLVDMALAASAPIFGFPGMTSDGKTPLCDQYAWNRVVTDAFRTVGGEACVDAIRAGYWQTSALSAAEVSAAFNTCTPASLPCHAQQVADMALYWTGTAAELGSYPPHANRSLLEWACGAMAGAATGLQAYMALLAPLAPGQCLNISWAWQCGPAADDDSSDAASAAAAVDVGRGGWCATHWNESDSGCQDGWWVIACPSRRGEITGRDVSAHPRLLTKATLPPTPAPKPHNRGIESCTTEVHPIESNNVTDFYPASRHPFNEQDRLMGCRGNYGGDLSIDGGAMPRSFGQIDLARMAASASRIIFSSGQYDPWSAMSVNHSLSPTLPFVYIQGGAHHSDIGNNCE
jgi:hypothetical protein